LCVRSLKHYLWVFLLSRFLLDARDNTAIAYGKSNIVRWEKEEGGAKLLEAAWLPLLLLA
jgi:hypothetical protein